MRIEGISPIGAAESSIGVTQVVSSVEASVSIKGQVPGSSSPSPDVLPGQSTGSALRQTDELIIGSEVPIPGPDGLVQAYARIRFDEGSHTVLIQIVNAANNKVIREIPPGAWEKLRMNPHSPAAMIADKKPEIKEAGGACK